MLSTPAEPFSCLTEVGLFADLSTAELAAMDLMTPARMFRAGELVFRVTEDGKALTMAILEPGAVFGEMLLVGQRMNDNYAEAIEDAAICQLSVADVERCFLSDPRIAVRISRLLGEQVARLEERLTDRALRPLGATRESTCKTMSDFAARNLIRQGRGRIIIQDAAALHGVARRTA